MYQTARLTLKPGPPAPRVNVAVRTFSRQGRGRAAGEGLKEAREERRGLGAGEATHRPTWRAGAVAYAASVAPGPASTETAPGGGSAPGGNSASTEPPNPPPMIRAPSAPASLQAFTVSSTAGTETS